MFHNTDHDELLTYVVMPKEEEFNSLEDILRQYKFEPRQYGEWIPIKNRKGETVAWRCSACGQSPKYAVNSDFCPRCGSDNRKSGEAE